MARTIYFNTEYREFPDVITPADEKTHGFNREDDSPQIF